MARWKACVEFLRRYKAKCVKTRCLQEGVSQFEPRFQGEGSSPCQYIDTTRKAIDCATTLPLTVFGRPFVKRFAVCYRSVVLSVCLSCLSICNFRALWPNGWTDQDETWHAGRPRPWPHCVRYMDSALPPPKGHSHPNFWPISGSRCHLVWSQASAQATLC